MDSETLNEQWARICAQVKATRISTLPGFRLFSRLVPQAMSDSFLMLTADNDFIKTWVEQHYTEDRARAARFTGVVFAVAIAVDPTQEQRKIAAAGQPSPRGAVFRRPPNRCRRQHLRSQRHRRWSLSFSAHRGSCAPSPAYGAPLSQATPSNHPAWSPIPCRGRRGRSLRASRARTVSPRSRSPSGLRILVFLTFENFVIGESNRMALLHGRRSCRGPRTASP